MPTIIVPPPEDAILQVSYLLEDPKRVNYISAVVLLAHEKGCLVVTLDYWRDQEGNKVDKSTTFKGGETVGIDAECGCQTAKIIRFERDIKN